MGKSLNDTKLSTRVLRCEGIISLYEGDDTVVFKSKLLQLFNSWDVVNQYYFIIHDGEFKDDGTEKLTHIHFIIVFSSQLRLQTILNKISIFLGIDTNRIGIQRLRDICAMLRYFLHLEESPDKKRYDIDEIISSENLETISHYVYSDEDATLSIKRLFALVMYYPNEIDLMYHIDLNLYHKYRHEIHSLYEHSMYLYGNYHFLLDELKSKMDKQTDNLPF